MPQIAEKPGKAVTLEQLLQLKRAERPTPDFWEEFDRELRRRQLASLVTVRPWYAKLGAAVSLFLKRVAPVGVAAAALVAGIVSVNESNKAESEPIYTAATPTEPSFVVLPEERVGRRTHATETPNQFNSLWQREQTELRYAVKELEPANNQQHAFVTVSAPVTLSAPREASDVYFINTLTSAPVHQPAANVEAASF